MPAFTTALVALTCACHRCAAQTDAPSVNPASPALLDRAGIPRLGVACDEQVTGGDPAPAFTLALRPREEPRVGLRATIGGSTPQGDSDWPSRRHEMPRHETTELDLGLLGTRAPELPATGTRLGLAFTADTYGTGFGRDVYAATAIVESRDRFVANLGYWQEERLHHGQRDHQFKLCAGRDWEQRIAGARPVDLTLGVGEFIRERGRGNVPLASARLDCSITSHTRVTGSVLLADATDRTGRRKVRGVLGISSQR